MNQSGLIRITALFVLLALIITLMIVAQQILIPLAWALLFAFILFPVCNWMEKKGVGRTWSSLISTLVFTIFAGIVLFYLVYQAVRILRQEGTLMEEVGVGFDHLQEFLEVKFGVSLFPESEEEGVGGLSTDLLGKVVNFVAAEISMIGKNLVTITLIPMFLFFLLLYRGLLIRFVKTKYANNNLETIYSFFSKSQFSIENYLWGTLILTGVTTIMSLIILVLFGVKYAFFFSIFIAVLNLIPYIGNLAAFAVVLFFVWVTKEDGYLVLFVGISLYAANLLQENFLRPKLIGDKMEMNAMIVFSAVIIGGMIWGFSGMVLFIPLLGVLKALFDSNPAWRPYSIFFESDSEAVKEPQTTVLERRGPGEVPKSE
jgi:predicted PurR-regulated permease PerM